MVGFVRYDSLKKLLRCVFRRTYTPCKKIPPRIYIYIYRHNHRKRKLYYVLKLKFDFEAIKLSSKDIVVLSIPCRELLNICNYKKGVQNHMIAK